MGRQTENRTAMIKQLNKNIISRELTLDIPKENVVKSRHQFDIFAELKIIHDCRIDSYIIKFVVMNETAEGLKASSYCVGKNYETNIIESHDHLDYAFKNLPMILIPCWMKSEDENDIINLASSFTLGDYTNFISNAVRLKN